MKKKKKTNPLNVRKIKHIATKVTAAMIAASVIGSHALCADAVGPQSMASSTGHGISMASVVSDRNPSGEVVSAGSDIVEVASAEVEAYTDGSGGARFWDGFTMYTGKYYDVETPWCVSFVYYCAEKCGYLTPDGTGCFGSEWYVNCGQVEDFFAAKSQIHDDPYFRPVPGDLVMYGDRHPNDPSIILSVTHMGIVKEVTEDGKLVVIEGNNADVLAELCYDSYTIGTEVPFVGEILYYIRPAYPQAEETQKEAHELPVPLDRLRESIEMQ